MPKVRESKRKAAPARKTAPAKAKPKTKSKSRAHGLVLERSIEIEVEFAGADLCDVRIDLLRSRSDAGSYRARLWRLERYRIQSTFPQTPNGEPEHAASDELILKEWESVPENFDRFAAKDVDAAEAYVFDRLERWLSTAGGVMR